MMKNAMSLKAKIRNYAREKNVSSGYSSKFHV